MASTGRQPMALVSTLVSLGVVQAKQSAPMVCQAMRNPKFFPQGAVARTSMRMTYFDAGRAELYDGEGYSS